MVFVMNTQRCFFFCRVETAFLNVGFGVLTGVVMKRSIFWGIVPFGPLNSQRCISEDKTLEFLNIAGSGFITCTLPQL
jgi:hypothetical protein